MEVISFNKVLREILVIFLRKKFVKLKFFMY